MFDELLSDFFHNRSGFLKVSFILSQNQNLHKENFREMKREEIYQTCEKYLN